MLSHHRGGALTQAHTSLLAALFMSAVAELDEEDQDPQGGEEVDTDWLEGLLSGTARGGQIAVPLPPTGVKAPTRTKVRHSQCAYVALQRKRMTCLHMKEYAWSMPAHE